MGSELNFEQAESSWTAGWCSWTRQSDAMLRNVEKKILSCVKTAYKRFYVDIGCVVGQSDKIWTISLNDESPKTPLVLLHGMGAGLALWCPNLDALAATRPVYALDLLGFGRSSRPKFSSDAEKVEAQWVESVEQWRREVNLGQFILLGHSLGGYIATAYAMKYPDRVRHLILADPWGFPERPANVNEKYQIPLWVRAIATVVQPLNPLWAVRAAGPAGSWLVSKTRPDLARKYRPYVADADALIPSYIHQCNAQTPSGESAFHSLMSGFGWARNPMVRRVRHLAPELPVTVLYGSRSWVDNSTAQVLCEHRQPGARTYVQEPRRYAHLYDDTGFKSVSEIWRQATKCRKTIYEIRRQVTKGRKTKHLRVESKIITGAGHHVYLDKPELFNKYVAEACARADEAERGAPEAERGAPEAEPAAAS